MFIGKVTGNVVSTSKDESLIGTKLLVVKFVNEHLVETGATEVAVDTVGAGPGEYVLVSKGSSARAAFGDKKIPADAVIVGIIDSVEAD